MALGAGTSADTIVSGMGGHGTRATSALPRDRLQTVLHPGSIMCYARGDTSDPRSHPMASMPTRSASCSSGARRRADRRRRGTAGRSPIRSSRCGTASACHDLTSSTLFSRKLEHINANPQVSLSITDPIAVGGRTDRATIQGDARVIDEDPHGGWERLLPIWEEKEPSIVSFLKARVALPLFFERALIEITPRRVFYWADGDTGDRPGRDRRRAGRPP